METYKNKQRIRRLEYAQARQQTGSSGTGSTTFTLGSGTTAPNTQGVAALTTPDATARTIFNVKLAPDQSVDIPVTFIARNTGAAGGNKDDTFSFDQRWRFKRVGGSLVATQVGATIGPINQGGDAGEQTISAQAVVDGVGGVNIQVLGVLGHTLAWAASFDEQFV